VLISNAKKRLKHSPATNVTGAAADLAAAPAGVSATALVQFNVVHKHK
jgi:hypothetical protein